jgi:hypothetical protein
MKPKREHYNALPLAPGKGERAKYKEVKPATFGRIRTGTHWSIKLTGAVFFFGLVTMAIQLIAEVIR